MALSTRGVFFFVQYVLLFVALAILVKQSQKGGKYSYNTTLVVLLVELVKFVVAASMCIFTSSVSQFLQGLHANAKLLLLYFLPAILYTLHNNLMFVSMTYLDPATYYVLLQFRVLVTAVLFQFLFKRMLSRLQWLALIILFVGCLLKELDRNIVPGKSAKTENKLVIFVVLFQVLCSCGAAVYTEYLLKSVDQATVHLQNVFMYSNSLLCNVAVLVLRSLHSKTTFISLDDFRNIMQPSVLAVVAVSAAGGLTTAFLLKYLDSVLKVYANSFEIVLTAIASYFLLGVRISALSYVALFTVCASLTLYKRGAAPTASVEKSPSKEPV